MCACGVCVYGCVCVGGYISKTYSRRNLLLTYFIYLPNIWSIQMFFEGKRLSPFLWHSRFFASHGLLFYKTLRSLFSQYMESLWPRIGNDEVRIKRCVLESNQEKGQADLFAKQTIARYCNKPLNHYFWKLEGTLHQALFSCKYNPKVPLK